MSLAQKTLARYAELARDEQLAFFQALKTEFSPHPQRVLAAATDYAAKPDSARLATFTRTAEPPRQELLKRLNRAPGGTRLIISMRERLPDEPLIFVEVALLAKMPAAIEPLINIDSSAASPDIFSASANTTG